MKFLELRLIAFGPFTERSLSFGEGNLHIIFGPNEAGKSSALRAVSCFLYGIPARTTDTFVHGNRELRIGATLQCADGKKGSFIRRKGSKQTFLDTDGNPCGDTAIDPFLGKVSESLFLQMFGLSHQRLIQGGRAIVEGEGDIGESIFAAGMGVMGLRGHLARQEAQADALFKAAGQKPDINKLISDFKEAKKVLKEASLPAAKYKEIEQALAGVLGERDLKAEALKDLHNELARLDRLEKAAPKVVLLKSRREALRELGDGRILADDFAERRKSNQQARQAAASLRTTLESEIAQLKESVEGHPVNERILAMDVEILELFGSRGAYTKNRKDLPGLDQKQDDLRKEAQRSLKRLELSDNLDQVEGLRLSDPQRRRISVAADELKSLRQQIGAASKGIETSGAAADELKQRIGEMPPLRTIDALQTALKHAGREGNLAAQESELTAKLKRARASANQQFKQLLPALKAGFEDVGALPVPLEETLQRFIGEETQLNQEASRRTERLRDLKTQQDKLRLKIETVTKGRNVPSEEDLVQQRQWRDQGWQLVRQAWEGPPPEAAAIQAFSEGGSLPDRYEESVKRADEVADELRLESDRVAQLQQLRVELQRVDDAILAEAERQATFATKREAWQKQWCDTWSPTGIEPLLPVEMKSWKESYDKLVESKERLQELALQCEQIAGRIEHLRERLMAEGELAGLPPFRAELSFDELLTHVEDELEKMRRQNEVRLQAERDLEGARKQVAKELNNLTLLQAEADRVKESWGGIVAPLGLSATSTPEDASQIVEGLNEVFRKLDEAALLEGRTAGVRKECKAFEAGVRQLLERLGDVPIDTPPQEAIGQLNQNLSTAQSNRAAVTQLRKQIEEKEAQCAETRVRIENLNEGLRQLLAEAQVEEEEQLEDVETRSNKIRALRQAEALLVEQLCDFAGGNTVEALVHTLEALDPATLPGLLSERDAEQKAVDQELSRLNEKVGEYRQKLAALDGSEAAALKAEEMEGILAAMRTKIEVYARARLGSLLLRREIERYRQEHQGPVLKRAGEFFARLTLGSFTGLSTDFGDNDKQFLVGTRPQGARITVEGMSDGTCDQLYLALRLASLEHHMETNGPMPLILDDILVNFDDDRALATLQILTEIAEKNQIIYFTHHRHILEIAKPLAVKVQTLA